jgi:hypothetical protein
VLPYSGHTLFLTYVLLTGPGRGFRAIAAVLLATTTWFKLALWDDPYSWALGIAIGAVLVALRRYAGARERRAQDDRDGPPRVGLTTVAR